jgi:hypothetical protein
VKKGSTFLQIRVAGFSNSKVKELEKAAALRILTRL